MIIEAENAKQEIKELISGCIKCGLCKAECPVFKILLEETFSPRGKILILEEEVYDKILYSCSLCKACEKSCPVGLKLSEIFRKVRVVLASKKENKKAKQILKNVQESGNIYGK